MGAFGANPIGTTDLIRGQSSQEDVSPDTKSSIRSIGPTGLPIPSPMCSPSIAEIDWYQCAYQELQEIKRAVQTRQPWAVDELARIASGVVASLRAHDTLVQTVLQSNAGDYPVSNAENVAIVSVKIAEALRYESAKLEQVAFAPYLRCVHLRHDPHHRGTSGNRKSALHQGVARLRGQRSSPSPVGTCVEVSSGECRNDLSDDDLPWARGLSPPSCRNG